MADDKTDNEASTEPTMVERWLADQQAWQKTALAYLDSMVNNDEFLVHLGNAMRGSLLAGKPYPTAPPAGAAEPQTETDDRIDRILHALHLMQGEMRDLRGAVERLGRERETELPPQRTAAKSKKSRKAKKPKAAGARDGDTD